MSGNQIDRPPDHPTMQLPQFCEQIFSIIYLGYLHVLSMYSLRLSLSVGKKNEQTTWPVKKIKQICLYQMIWRGKRVAENV